MIMRVGCYSLKKNRLTNVVVVVFFIYFLIGGGWNNVRMGIETTVAMAIAMGRTLVLPPLQTIYLLEKVR
jgi:hypothetical protein